MARRSIRKLMVGAVCGVSASALVLSGCAIVGYSIAADDPCGSQRRELKDIGDYLIGETAKGAFVGAVLGAAVGGAAGRDSSSVLLGAAAGALAGGLGSYFFTKQKMSSSQDELVRSIYSDVAGDNGRLDTVTSTFRGVRDCRFRAAEAVRQDFAASRLNRPAAEARLGRIRSLFQEDITYAEALGARMKDRGGGYDTAAAELLKLDPQAQQLVARRGLGQDRRGFVANQDSRVRAAPSMSGPQIGGLRKGERVRVLDLPNTPADWLPIELPNDRVGYVGKRLLDPATASVGGPAAPPPQTIVGVAQLTESNVLKRKALADDLDAAKVAAASGFELDAKISHMPRPLVWIRG